MVAIIHGESAKVDAKNVMEALLEVVSQKVAEVAVVFQAEVDDCSIVMQHDVECVQCPCCL